MNIRDSLFKNYGSDFRSSHQDMGIMVYPDEISYPWGETSCQDFHVFFAKLKHEFNFYLLMDISFEKNSDGGGHLYYQLLNLEDYFRLTVHVKFKKGPFIPGLSHLWRSARSFEQELEERFQILISDGIKSKQWAALNKKEEESTEEMAIRPVPQYKMPVKPSSSDLLKKWYQVGPLSSPLNGKARLDFLLHEETVDDCLVEKGFCYRGFEEAIKKKTYAQSGSFIQRLCSRDSIFAPLLWFEAIESRFSIDIPQKAQAMRMVWMELARIEGHLTYLHELCRDLGFLIEASSLAELVEQVYHLYYLYSGKMQNFSIFTYGGMKNDFPMGWSTECLEVAKYLQKELESIQNKLVRNNSWMQMTHGCPFSATEALEFGLSGPNLRACGVNYDLRKRRPRYYYKDVDFEVPLGIDGNTYDRFLVRIEEIKQSIKIVNQVLDHLPAGESVNNEHALSEDKIENLSSEIDVAYGHSYSFVESTEGELGLCLNTTQDHRILHFHLRSPSFVHLHSYPKLVSGQKLNHALTAFLSLGIDAWEMDR